MGNISFRGMRGTFHECASTPCKSKEGACCLIASLLLEAFFRTIEVSHKTEPAPEQAGFLGFNDKSYFMLFSIGLLTLLIPFY